MDGTTENFEGTKVFGCLETLTRFVYISFLPKLCSQLPTYLYFHPQVSNKTFAVFKMYDEKAFYYLNVGVFQ